MSGKLFMIPCPIAENEFSSLSGEIASMISSIKCFVVERARTTRRFIKAYLPETNISELEIFELDKNNPKEGLESFLLKTLEGHDIGLLSEAGCPGIADPGRLAVMWCHKKGVTVVPLVGPSSILLALMASGFNGQNFAFNGYLPNKKNELIKKLRILERKVIQDGQTQLFMDAPYRNGFLMESCINALQSNTLMSIACDLDSANAFIKTMPIGEWKKENYKHLHKRPAIFSIGRT